MHDAKRAAPRLVVEQARFKPLAFQEDIKTGEPLNKFIAEQAVRWREVIVENNIKVE